VPQSLVVSERKTIRGGGGFLKADGTITQKLRGGSLTGGFGSGKAEGKWQKANR